MARKAREKSESGLYAVLLRGSADIFAADDDREKFMNLLEKLSTRSIIFIYKENLSACLRRFDGSRQPCRSRADD